MFESIVRVLLPSLFVPSLFILFLFSFCIRVDPLTHHPCASMMLRLNVSRPTCWRLIIVAVNRSRLARIRSPRSSNKWHEDEMNKNKQNNNVNKNNSYGNKLRVSFMRLFNSSILLFRRISKLNLFAAAVM